MVKRIRSMEMARKRKNTVTLSWKNYLIELKSLR